MARSQHGVRWAMLIGAVLGVVFGTACSDDSASSGGAQSAPKPTVAKPLDSAKPLAPTSKPVEPVADTRTPEQLVEAGRAVYMGNCIACHNMDPATDGALGPAVAGASRALLERRVLHGDYPEGYTPKRTTRVMIPLPHLESKLAELTAYLAAIK